MPVTNPTLNVSVVHLGTNGLPNISGNSVTTLTTNVSNISLPVPGNTATIIDEQHGMTLSGPNFKSIATYTPGSLLASDGVLVTAQTVRSNTTAATDLTGRPQLSGVTGAFILNFSGTYSSPPVCACWDTDHPANQCTTSSEVNTSVQFNGTKGDHIKYVCVAQN
jgi:hypothetical protein